MSDDQAVAPSKDSDDLFTQDVMRAVLLAAYMRQWGMPSRRTRAYHPKDDHLIDVYVFTESAAMPVHRFVTACASWFSDQPASEGKELMLALPDGLGGATEDEVCRFVLDVAAYLRARRRGEEPPMTVPETPLAPRAWKARALLIDEVRGESEELASIAIGAVEVELLWVVPIFASEYAFIKAEGFEAFDEKAQDAELSLVDVDRSAFV